MSAIQRCILGMVGAIGLLAATSSAWAQITINELVVNERDYNGIVADTGEFLELFNAGGSAVDISGWKIMETNLAAVQPGNTTTKYTIPNGSSIPAGGYFVIGANGVSHVNWTPAAGELFPDDSARVLELRDNGTTTIDAVAYDVWGNNSTAQLNNASAAQIAQLGSGYHARLYSFIDTGLPNEKTSLARYRDGRDNNSTGRDFGHIAVTPGTTNNILPIVPKHTVPNVDFRPVEDVLAEYNASFVSPRVIFPSSVSASNFRNDLGQSPQGGNAIIAWDPVGGGNTTVSKQIVNSFDIYAYFDTTPLGITSTAQQFEASLYGIGTADARFATADPRGAINGTGGVAVTTENAATGIGWYYERWQSADGTQNSVKLMLIDFGDGGNSDPSASQWSIKETIDLTGMDKAWYRLSVDYDPATGAVVARFGNNTYNFNAGTQVMGTFVAGYRETLDNLFLFRANPPVFDWVSRPGDFDSDGDVDGADFVAWQTNFPKETGATYEQGDADGDGDIDGADFVIWQTNFPFNPNAGTSPVPEPATALLAGVFAAAVAFRKFRRA